MVHDGFRKWGYHNNGKSVNILLKRMIWGYLHFRKPKTIEFLNWWVTSFFTTVLQHFSTSPVLQVSLQSVPTENPVDEGSSLGAAGNGPFLGFVVGIPDLGLNKMMAKIFGKPSNTTLFHGLTISEHIPSRCFIRCVACGEPCTHLVACCSCDLGIVDYA